jgi:hypothetical protein
MSTQEMTYFELVSKYTKSEKESILMRAVLEGFKEMKQKLIAEESDTLIRIEDREIETIGIIEELNKKSGSILYQIKLHPYSMNRCRHCSNKITPICPDCRGEFGFPILINYEKEDINI